MEHRPGPLSRRLSDIYYDPSSPGGYRSPEALYQEATKTIPLLTRKQVSDYILKQASYTKHRQYRKIKRYRRVITKGPNYLWQIDLLDFTTDRYTRVNSGYRYILCCIDTFSKRLWTWPLRRKTAKEVHDALFYTIVNSRPRVKKIQTDQGMEFFNRQFKTFLRNLQIPVQLYHSWTDKKASIVERCQRTLRNRLGKYWEMTGSLRWVDVLQDVTDSYNNSYHRTIGMTPNEVTGTRANIRLIRRRMYPRSNQGEPGYEEYRRQRIKNMLLASKTKDMIKIGDFVRVLTDVKRFPKESDKNFTNEIFRVSEMRDPMAYGYTYDLEPITFKITRLRGAVIPRGRARERKSIKGSFYQSELQKIKRSERELVQEPIPPPDHEEQPAEPQLEEQIAEPNIRQEEIDRRNIGNRRVQRDQYNFRVGRREPIRYPR